MEEQNQELNNNKPSNNPDLNSSFLKHNGFNHKTNDQDSKNDTSQVKISDIEMIAIQTITYTSLKDILPTSPPSVTSPTHSSWNEITIKNPLVKQAARAYLQPMSTPPETGDKGLFGRFKERCCGGCCGFVSWFRQIFFRTFKGVVMMDHDCDYDDDCDEDDCDYDHHHEKVY